MADLTHSSLKQQSLLDNIGKPFKIKLRRYKIFRRKIKKILNDILSSLFYTFFQSLMNLSMASLYSLDYLQHIF